jgi:predicted nucleic acid-binding protein
LATAVITLDTSGVVALLNARDPDHEAAKSALERAGRPYIVPTGILSEVAYLIEARMPNVLDGFLADLESGAFSQDCGDEATTRVRQLVDRYLDLRLGYADAAVIACAERNGGLVLTFDRRDFGVVAREGTIHIAPD